MATIHHSKPWLRYLAKYIDIAVYTLLISILFIITIFIFRYLGMDTNIFKSMPKFIFSIIFLILMIFVEIFIFYRWSTTPGKKLLNIKITKEDGSIITYNDAFIRTLKVWIKGLGLGIPIITFFTQIAAFNKLNTNGITSWDEEGGFKVIDESVAIWRIVLAGIIILGLFVSYVKFAR